MILKVWKVLFSALALFGGGSFGHDVGGTIGMVVGLTVVMISLSVMWRAKQ